MLKLTLDKECLSYSRTALVIDAQEIAEQPEALARTIHAAR